MIRVAVKPSPALVTNFSGKVRRRLAAAINRTLEEGQARGRQLLHQRLTVRTSGSARYLENLVKFERFDRATPDNLSGRMGLQDTGTGTRRRSAALLIALTRGDTRSRPVTAPFFIPTTGPGGLRPTPPSVIPRSLYPSALRLARTRFTINSPGKQTKRGKRGTILVGKRGTFAIDPEFHAASNPRTYGVWQRTGRGASSQTHLLWSYRVQRTVRKRLPFQEEVLREVRQRWPINVAGFIATALKSK